MAENFVWVILTLVGLPGGMIVGWWGRKFWATKQIDTAEAKLNQQIIETKNKQKEMLIQAKDKAQTITEESNKEAEQNRKELRHMQERLEKRESLFDKKLLSLEESQQKIQ